MLKNLFSLLGYEPKRLENASVAPSNVSQENTRHHVKTKWIDLDYAEITHIGKTMRYVTTGSSSAKRIRSLFTKEPITLAWIDSFKRGQTLYDIGANVGMYTIYAAVMRDAKVISFEPESLNYAELNKNIYVNDLHNQVLAYGLALSDIDKADRLLLSDFGLGIAYHDFEENSWAEDKEFAPDWKVSKDNRRPQGCIGRRVDSLVADGIPIPDHIKIDVDGLEHRVVAGMMATLREPQLKTILIEINFDNPKNLEIINIMQDLGWRFSWDQLRVNRKVKFTVEQIEAYQRRRIGGLNYIFYKDDYYDRLFSDIFKAYSPGHPIIKVTPPSD
ncbi:FkbM family methyltransferase [Sphingobium phenoxybenzoativorans]|uniref:FkbM family methyltransferase n=1 Tax=Sphingobium phenoxybenzoativorans TaxID=1592790 RepID=A0A975K3U1_9SPHN|nr:FkbM family methyltransferase [Sphingobium phenoxybenzoativorans]QUT04366.1 FkbM family methyltransferase [Sphingobium phenoxybenzoativorans]